MKRIFKILKPYTWAVVLAVGLLFVQAVSDLNLPNLMSDIVNVGIQQSGVEHGAPEVLPTDGYDFLTAFMTDDPKPLRLRRDGDGLRIDWSDGVSTHATWRAMRAPSTFSSYTSASMP